MRIQNLTLERFGHFTGRKFDFGSASNGNDFHIIYGPNEAGKTTTMEAVLRLFYGFPTRESYDFKHQRKNLQVSATLDIDGALREFTRRPTRSGSLIDSTETPLPEAALSAHLAGLSEGDYRRLLCLDDETIERGGEEIANAKGDIGRLLFSAAAGVADLSSVLDSVREKADALWKKRGRTTRMADLKRELAEVEKQIKERDVSANAWKALKRDLAKAQQAEHDARTARDILNTSKAQIEAQLRALPLLAEIHILEQAITPWSTYPDHLDFDPERLIELRTDRGLAVQNIARLTDEIAAFKAEREGLSVDPKLLALSTALHALEGLSARDLTAQFDLDRREQEQQQAEAAMQMAARDLGVTSLDLQHLVLSGTDIATLESVRETLRAAITQVTTEAHEVANLKTRVATADKALQDRAPVDASTQKVADILQRFDVDALAPAHAAAVQAVDAARIIANRARAALTQAGVTFDPLPACPTTLLQAAAWADHHRELVNEYRITTDKRDEHLETAKANCAQAATLTQGAKIIPDADALDLLALRDARWREHLADLTPHTATNFHQAMRQHDTAADARLAQSNELAQLRQLAQAEADACARADQANTRLAALYQERTTIEASVAGAASQIGLPVSITPAEWQDWVQRHEAASAHTQTLRETEDANQLTIQRADTLLAELTQILPFPPLDLGSALNAARRIAEDQRKQAETRTKAEEALKQAQNDLSDREALHNAAVTAQTNAETAWQLSVRDLIAEEFPAERLMPSLEPLRELREHEKTRAAADQRVTAMRADQKQFGEKVGALARAHDIEPDSSAATTFTALKDLAEQARAAEEKARMLDQKIEKAVTEKTQHQIRQDQIDLDVEAIAAVFPGAETTRDIDALRQVATRAQQVIEDRATLKKHEAQVLSELGVADIEAARGQLSDSSTTVLAAKLSSTESDLIQAEEMFALAIQQRVTSEHAHSEVNGDDTIAALVEHRTTIELRLEEAAVEHLELSLGHYLASDAIRRYRDSHRSGMMSATEQCFASLTNGAYPSLSTQTDKDAEVLLAVDRNGVSKRAAEMSKGTRFQLYLALRAAAHEQLVSQGTKLPFFCDDIFETFDEARTSAACRVMETIGGRGQAIYLTHHRHVVDIAQSVCTTPPIVHEL